MVADATDAMATTKPSAASPPDASSTGCPGAVDATRDGLSSPPHTLTAAPASAMATSDPSPLEKMLVADMRGVLRGNLTVLPRFVGDLLRYFEDGARPGMPPAELSQHLMTKASFVLGCLFRMPEVTEAHGGLSGSPGPPPALPPLPVIEEDEAAVPAPPGITAAPSDARGAAASPRWFDVFLGACLTSAAWKLAVGVWALQFAPRRSLALACVVALFCVHRSIPSLTESVGDGLVLWMATEVHQKRYAVPVCAWAMVCAAARTYV